MNHPFAARAGEARGGASCSAVRTTTERRAGSPGCIGRTPGRLPSGTARTAGGRRVPGQAARPGGGVGGGAPRPVRVGGLSVSGLMCNAHGHAARGLGYRRYALLTPLSRRDGSPAPAAASALSPSPAWPATQARPPPTRSRRRRRTYPRGPSGSSSCSCRAASATSIRSTTSRGSTKDDGKQMPFDDARSIANTGKRGASQRVMKPLWKFAQHGAERAAGRRDLFPEMAKHVDDLCFIHSHAHRRRRPRPGDAVPALRHAPTSSARRWARGCIYGLGTENENLPGFVTIAPSLGNGGPRNYGNAFLPAVYQGTALGQRRRPAAEATIRNLASRARADGRKQPQFDLLRELQRRATQAHARRHANSKRSSTATNSPGGCRATPRTCSTSRKEIAETLALYGIGEKATDNFGRQCLMARRLCESRRALRAGDLRRQHRQPRVGPALEPAQARRPRQGRGQADRRAARRPQAARPARRHASSGGAASSAARRTPRRTAPAATTTPAASPSGSPAAASSPASPTARPTSSATTPSRTRSTCTTCTRRSCTCSASTTNG